MRWKKVYISSRPLGLFELTDDPSLGRDSLELNNRASFIDFCQGLLNMNPIERWSPQQARLHPFITGEKFTKPFVVSYDDLWPAYGLFSHVPSAVWSPFTAASYHFGCFTNHDCVGSQTSIWRACPISTQGYASIPGCRFVQPAPGSASGLHRPSPGCVPSGK